MRFRLICVLSIVVPLIGWLEVNSSSPFIGTPTTGFSATFAPSYATLALVDLPLDGGGPDANGDATETRTPAEAPTPAETQTPAETPIPTPTPAPEAAVTPTATVTVTATAAVAVTAPVVSCVQPFPVIPPDMIENERAVADSINAERLRYGLPPLTLVAELSQSARLHSLDMADNN
ncbi:MAG: hypothetical protein Q7R39_09125 [Dehalococcoidia bacterium]|nr:hypothetical protein [Dehalococcoidia bacterium]